MCIFSELRFPSEILFFIVLVIKSSPHPVCTARVGGVGREGDPLRSFQKCQHSVSLHCAACWLRRTGSPDFELEYLVPDFELEMPLTFHSHKTNCKPAFERGPIVSPPYSLRGCNNSHLRP